MPLAYVRHRRRVTIGSRGWKFAQISTPFRRHAYSRVERATLNGIPENILRTFQEKALSVGLSLTTTISTYTLIYKVLSFRSTLGAPLLARAASVQESLHNTEEHPGTKYGCANH